MKRIAFINKVFLDSTLPAVNFSVFNAYAFAQKGYDSHLYVQKCKDDFNMNTIFDEYGLEKKFNFTIHDYTAKKYVGIRSNQFFYFKIYRDIKKQHKSNPFDLIISRDPGALPYLIRIKKNLNITVLYQPHNFYLDLKIRPDLNKKNARKYSLLERKYLSAVNGILCLQKPQSEWYRKYLDSNNVYILKPGYVQKSHITDANRFHDKTIGYIGSLQYQKGINILLQAVNKLKQDNFPVKVIIVGGRDLSEINTIKKKLADLQLEDIVHLTGWLKYSEIKEILKRMTIGILPLMNNFYNQYLTAPNKLFDYLSSEVPVISADLPSVRHLLDNTNIGIYFEPGNADALSKEIKNLLSNKSRYYTCVQRIKNNSDKLLWSYQINRLEKELNPE